MFTNYQKSNKWFNLEKTFYSKEVEKYGQNTAKLWRILGPIIPKKFSNYCFNKNEMKDLTSNELNTNFTEEPLKQGI